MVLSRLLRHPQPWTEDEKLILTRLLEGRSARAARLRQQLSPPFCLAVDRYRNGDPYRKQRAGEPPSYSMVVNFDECLLGEYRADECDATIDDFVFIDDRVPGDIHLKGSVRFGVLVEVVASCEPPQTVKWPKHLRMSKHSYIAPDGQRLASRRADHWLNQDPAPATDPSERVRGIEGRLGVMLPPEWTRFYADLNGGEFGSIRLFPSTEVYRLDLAVPGGDMLVVGSDLGGNVIAIELPIGQLWLLDHETGAREQLAPSLDALLAQARGTPQE